VWQLLQALVLPHISIISTTTTTSSTTTIISTITINLTADSGTWCAATKQVAKAA
jgi:hypothetical protein